jgi:ADP-ribose pyrophosphatase YjhB (NUDIX family)
MRKSPRTVAGSRTTISTVTLEQWPAYTTASGGSCVGSGFPRRAPSRRATKPRAAAVVVNVDQVLVTKRHKRGRDYAVLPGGGIEEGETAPEAALRELYEETTPVAEIDRLLWTGRHNDRPAWYFLMTAVRGRAELSGPQALTNRPDAAAAARATDRLPAAGSPRRPGSPPT